METGIPVHKAIFHQAVNNGNGEPQSQFFMSSSKKQQKVKMSWVSNMLICFHEGVYFGTPLTNVHFLGFGEVAKPNQKAIDDGKSPGASSAKALV